uniref:Tyrosine-protein kinase catalytic domain-containing protein n=1 Tax=Ananas comosus var. bracteatus TaxID=296719 RepID=A0A6V7P6N4_ANACO|nr:unnamed protein product [Ananas comosus var. bracteatus]
MPKPLKFLENLMKPFRRRRDREAEEDLEAIAAKEQKVFRYETLAAATRASARSRSWARAASALSTRGGGEAAGNGSRQGAKEFTNEAMLLSRVQHKNVVNLYGYCTHGNDKLLVYEYVPNESLDKLLFAEPEGRGARSWTGGGGTRWWWGWRGGCCTCTRTRTRPSSTATSRRATCCWTIAGPPRSPTSAWPASSGGPHPRQHPRRRHQRLHGPEYLMHGALSTKADVFSFGVLLLELVSGRKNSSFIPLADADADTLLEWAWKLHRRGQSLDLMDPALRTTAVPEQVKMCVHVGLLCTQADPKLRPDMKRVVVILSKKPSTLEDPTRPGVPGSRYRRRALGPGGSRYSGESSSSMTSPLRLPLPRSQPSRLPPPRPQPSRLLLMPTTWQQSHAPVLEATANLRIKKSEIIYIQIKEREIMLSILFIFLLYHIRRK